MCDPNLTFKRVTTSRHFHKISVDDVNVGDLVYIVEPKHPRMGAQCAVILGKEFNVYLTYKYLSIDSVVSTNLTHFRNNDIQIYKKTINYQKSREPYIHLVEGTNNARGSIARYLHNRMQ
jgi:hypothetical protein